MRNRMAAAAAAIQELVIAPVDGLGTIIVLDACYGAGRKDVIQPGQATARREREEADFLVPVASLVRNGSIVLPAAGDRYTADGVTYQVRKADGKADWDYMDTLGTRVRVKTKKV